MMSLDRDALSQPPAKTLPVFLHPLVIPHFITLGVMVVSANTNTLGLQRARVGGWVGRAGSRH